MYTAGAATIIPPMVSVFHRQVGWMSEDIAASAPSSAAWPAANRAIYHPVILRAGCVVRRVWWANGATTTGGATIEVGVYADSGYGPGAKLISGSATQGTANEVQFVDVTDQSLPPGLYWLAIGSSSATNTFMFGSSVASVSFDASRRFEENSASPLPATATPVEATADRIYLFGFSTTASP